MKKIYKMLLAGILTAPIVHSAAAKDLFVAPAPIEEPKLNATWPVTPSGAARFAFAVPEDMDAFESARIVFVPTATASGTYRLELMVKRDSELSSMFDVVEEGNLPLAFNANQVTEVDVSSIFSGVFDETSAGNDYVSLILQTSSNLNNSGRVLGLRFVYDSAPLPGSALADGSVDSVKIKNGSITSLDVKNQTLTGVDVQEDSLLSGDLKDGTVGEADLAPDAVTSDKVFNGSLTGEDVAPNTLSAFHLADEAGVDYAGGSQTVTMGAHPATVRSIDVKAPSDGHVLVTATGSFALSLNNAEVACGLRADATPTIPPDPVIGRLGSSPHGSSGILPFAITKGFAVKAGATTTFRLICNLRAPNGVVLHSNLTAIFSPTRY